MTEKNEKPGISIDKFYDILEDMTHDEESLEDVRRQRNGLPVKKHGRRRVKTKRLDELKNVFKRQQ